MRIQNFQLPAQWTLEQAEETVAIFTNSVGDALSINYFPKVPDIAADLSDVRALRSFYRTAAESNDVAMLEVDPTQIAGLPAVRTILKARLQPRGFAFIGSYTLPFADRSYVLKVQSDERGITGVREAAVLAMETMEIEVDEQTGKMVGWEQDPYDSSYRAPFLRNRADDEKYDVTFPDHPLSKVRSYLRELAEQLDVASEIRSAKPFKYKSIKSGIWSWLRR
jgi:hypothetical protein